MEICIKLNKQQVLFHGKLNIKVERNKDLMSKFNKYPQNILFFLIILFICVGIILFGKEYGSFNFVNISQIQPKKSAISSLAKFKLSNLITLGSKTKPLSIQELKGTGGLDIDLINGDIKVSSLDIEGDVFQVKKINHAVKVLDIKLDPAHSSIGTVNLSTGKIDLSVGIVVEMILDKNLRRDRVSLVIPLTGNLARESGTLNLTGEMTIPPGKLAVPMPVAVTVSAISL